MKFTDHLWKRIEPIYQEILEMPFIKELTEGTLPEETFLFYLKQDTLYLADFTRALSIAGVRSDDNPRMQSFLEFAVGAIAVERQLHEDYYEQHGTTMDATKSPSGFAYTHYLLSRATLGSYPELIGALLPCFWIYREVGMEIYNNASDDNPYQAWIDTYAGEEFNQSVERAIEITDEVAENETDQHLKQMEEAFVYSTVLEWMFWDSAYSRESWPFEDRMEQILEKI